MGKINKQIKSQNNSNKLVQVKIKHDLKIYIALALVDYARKNNIFAAWLRDLLGNVNIAENLKNNKYNLQDTNLQVLQPENMYTAYKRARWLIDNDEKQAVAILQNGVKNIKITSPKQIVIGIVGLAVPGPTLGILNKKKKMSLIVHPSLVKNAVKLAIKTNQASHELFKRSLFKAKNNFDKLEPDMADWFYGDKDIALYKAGAGEFSEIKKTLDELGVEYAEIKDGENALAMAISPLVSNYYQEVLWNLDAL